MESIVHEDKPEYDMWHWLSMIVYPSYRVTSFPIKYQVFNNKLRIVFGLGAFHLDVPFDNLETTQLHGSISSGIDFTTCLSRKRLVQIIQKGRGLEKKYINISPNKPEQFLVYLNGAMNKWKNKNEATLG